MSAPKDSPHPSSPKKTPWYELNYSPFVATIATVLFLPNRDHHRRLSHRASSLLGSRTSLVQSRPGTSGGRRDRRRSTRCVASRFTEGTVLKQCGVWPWATVLKHERKRRREGFLGLELAANGQLPKKEPLRGLACELIGSTISPRFLFSPTGARTIKLPLPVSKTTVKFWTDGP